MLLALVSAALAAPLSPVGMQDEPLSVEVAAVFSIDRQYLRAFQDTCTGDNCDALRINTMQGGQIDLRLIKYLGIYAGAAHAHEVNSATIFVGDGWAAEAGAKVTVPIRPTFGVDAWGGANAARTTTPDTQPGDSARQVSRRVEGTVGAALHGGSADDAFVGWVGAEAAVFDDDRTLVLDDSVDLALHPGLPASVVAGFFLVSSPLGGPWTNRGHVGAGASGSVGYRTGLQLWVSGAF